MDLVAFLALTVGVLLSCGYGTMSGPCPEARPGHVDMSDIDFSGHYFVIYETKDDMFYPGHCVTDTKREYNGQKYARAEGITDDDEKYKTTYEAAYFKEDGIWKYNQTILRSNLKPALPPFTVVRILYTSANCLVTSPCETEGENQKVKGAALCQSNTISKEERNEIFKVFEDNGMKRRYLKKVDQKNC